MQRATWNHVAAAAIVLLALALRLREPLSSPIVGAEDPYLRMANAWDLREGRYDSDYPVGFSLFLLPFTLLGADGFYLFARFFPPVLGAVQVLGMYLLARTRFRPSASLSVALVVALMPENVFRTNLLFPTALDLAILPFLFLGVIRAAEGSLRGGIVAGALTLVLLLTHPWAVALLVPTVGLFLVAQVRDRRRALQLGGGLAGAAALLFALLTLVPGAWNPAPEILKHAWPALVGLFTSGYDAPIHVNLPAMLTWPILLLGMVGVVVAAWRRSDLEKLALAWTLLLLPLVLVDWFDIWFLPHRTVAYMSLGVALLVGALVDAAARDLLTPFDPRKRATPEETPPFVRLAGGVAILLTLSALALPAAAAVDPWYRLYDRDDYRAWDALRDAGAPLVVSASWQGAEGYTAITGRAAQFNPQFFHDGATRDHMLRETPGIVVLVDAYGRESDLPRGFLDGWEKVGEWGDVRAYKRD